MEFKKGDKVKLPFDETGTIVEGKDHEWIKTYRVRIRKATFNKTNQIIDFLERQLIPE
jgi:hypothetical protein